MKYLLVLTLTYIATGAAVGKKEEVPVAPVKKPHEKDGEHNVHYDHEAIIGSRKKEEEYDEMDEEEAKQKLTFLVAEHDSNNDQIITKEELIAWITNSFKNLDEEDSDEKRREEDDDDDGKVSWDEFLKAQYNYQEGDIADFKKQRNEKKDDPQLKETFEVLEVIEDDEARFMAADANHDGKLNKEEYYAFHSPHDYPHMHEFEIKRLMNRYDTDKDGSITKKEFVGDLSDRERIIAEEENFNLYDTNKDQLLKGEEIFKWVIQDNTAAATEEAEHLINLADDNRNEELSLEEIVDHYDKFVGNRATSYGTHLEDEL